ncbi:SGNH/GDSL hydrolase family protein [bacterium]|nr:SGNH/GDSL hydrolase family protein [bacterium]
MTRRLQMKLFSVLCAVVLGCSAGARAEGQPDIEIVDGVIQFFPGKPKDGMIARHQIPGEQIWVGAVRRNGKTRQVRIHSRHGGRGTKATKRIRFLYPFGADSATWNMDVKRDGDTVSVDMPWNGTCLGELMDVNEGAAEAASTREKLGVTGPASGNLPVLYSSGDSISLGYWPYLEGELWKVVNVYYQRELWKDIPSARSRNNGHAHLAYACLQTAYKSKGFKPDYMMVNFGLHMIATHTSKHGEYGQWVKKFIELAKEHNARLIWVTTTPYGSFRAKQNITIKQFNALASRTAGENGASVIDLHACVEKLIKELGEKSVYTDGVHFTEDVKKQQAEFMAKRIREIIGKRR